MCINANYLLIWFAVWSIVGHQSIIKKIKRTSEKHPNSKAEMLRTMMHISMTIFVLPIEYGINSWSAIEKRNDKEN